MLPQRNRHVNETTFQIGLRFQTGLSSLGVSCKDNLRARLHETRSELKSVSNIKPL